MTRLLPTALLALLALPAAAGAQSLFSTRGLGVPIAPLDARSRALGGIGVGILGWSGALVNPAEVAGVVGRGVVASIQPSRRSVAFDGREDELGGTRFPLIRAVQPLGGRFVLSAGYGSFLDQSWAVVSEGTEIIGGQALRTRDLVESDGGVAQARLDLAYWVSPSLGVGVGAGLYTGRLDRVVSRTFPDTALFEGFETRATWNFSGPLLAAGVWWEPVSIARVAASVTWSGELHADAEDDASSDLRADLPLQFAAGASGRLSPQLLATVGGRWAGWGSAAGAFDDPDAAADTWEMGAGVEWTGGTALGRTVPLRAGVHYARLPFRVQGEAPTEWAVALGTGAVLARDELGPRALMDATLERGRRGDVEATGLTESFWRFTLSVSLFGQ